MEYQDDLFMMMMMKSVGFSKYVPICYVYGVENEFIKERN